MLRYNPPAYSLDRDLHLDIGKAWAEFGLTLPSWPRIVIGYEYQFKNGVKSTLEWGDVYDTKSESRKIYPAYEAIDEQVHIIKLDVNHELGGFQIEDNFRAEFYDLGTSRGDVDTQQPGKSGPDKLILINESDNHFQAANTIRLERQFRDWLFASGGYLYSHLDGNAGFSLDTVLTANAPLRPVTTFGFDKRWFSNQILLDQESHVFNVNAMLGPWQGLTLSAGLQSEWMSQHGYGDVRLFEGDLEDLPALTNAFLQPVLLSSDLDKFSVDENFALRFTKIPFTVLFADARFQQESYGQYEEEFQGAHDFLRDTDATSDLKEYRVGFNTSPWQRVSLNAHYKHRDHRTDYDHLTDIARSYDEAGNAEIFANEGYPAFIRSREIESDEVEVKLVLKPATWLKTTFSYQIVATDYHTSTDPVSPDISPGGSIFAGNYDAHVYSVNATLNPWRRLYLSTTFSYRDTRMATAQNGATAVVPYAGDVYSVVTAATYVLNESIDLHANYSFSRADYRQNNEANGLPLGIVYDWNGVQVGITRRFNKNVTTNLQYSFFKYDEPSSGNLNNYTAHGLFASLTWRLP